MKNITIQDIARHAKVSKSTVSRVLNNTSAVTEDKRKAVLDATRKLGFRPNVFARSLASGRSMTIGVLTQIIGSPFYNSISQGVIARLAGTGYSPIFSDGQWQLEKEIDTLMALKGRQVDGLILIGGTIPPEQLNELCDGLPTVVVARQLPGDEHHCVFTDNVAGGFCATKILLDHGHQRIAFINGIERHPDAIDRLIGYRQALRQARIAYDPQLICQGDFSAKSGVRAIQELIARRTEFTAVFAGNDSMAFGARLALYHAGLRVPEDVSIVGFDDQPEASYMTPPLTTIRQPGHEMGVRASEALLAIISGRPFSSERLHGESRIRESVAPPR